MNVTMVEEQFDNLLKEFSEDLERIDRELQTAGRRSYRVEGAHVMVGPGSPLSDEYFEKHGLTRPDDGSSGSS